MAGQLMILPVRLGARITRFAVRTGIQLSGEAVSLASGAVKSLIGPGGQPPRDRAAPPPPDRPAQRSRERAAGPPPARPTPPPARPAPPPPPVAEEVAEPVHVSEEPELVEEFAEPGAEDGAGAEVNVAEPWDGYAQLTASDVVDRLSGASNAELAAIDLYETANRHRETVLSAVRRELRVNDASTAPTDSP